MKSMNVNKDAINRNYSTCILFLTSEVTTELINTIIAMKLLSQSTTTTKLLYLTHTIPHTCSHNKFDQNK
jgi:hypothetical protein